MNQLATLTLPLLLSCSAVLASEGPAASPDPEAQEKAERLKHMAEAAGKYEILVGKHPVRAELVEAPVFRWTNPIRKSLDGGLFIWTAQGRPQAMVGIFTRDKVEYQFEFQSLAVEPLTASRQGRLVWHPEIPGVEMRDLVDADPPAQSESIRSRQMRVLAGSFRSMLREAGKAPVDLRLLPRPVYRYASDELEITDGALFLFAQGTDPEVMLLLEARAPGDSPRWSYGFARVTWAPVEAHDENQKLWSVGYWNRVPEPQSPYIVFKGMQIP
jgi:hypothetical protein